MGINVTLRDERCNNIGEMVVDIHGVIAHSLPAPDDVSYVCIRFIDPYGDTVFNHMQARVVIDEWDRLQDSFIRQDAKQLWSDIRTLIAYCASDKGIHRYVVFIGD